MKSTVFIVLLALCGCSSPRVTTPAMHTVLNRHQTPAAYNGYWRPTEAELAALETDLAKLWAKPDHRVIFSLGKRGPGSPLSDYFIRYYGAIAGGKKIIVGEAVHRGQESALKYIEVEPEPAVAAGVFQVSTSRDVAGGGSNYFTVTYDLESKSVLMLRFNAPL